MTPLKPRKLLALLPAASCILVVCAALYTGLEVSANKILWTDEGFELEQSCRQNYRNMLSDGVVSQCSPAPLYYVLQKAVFAWLTPFHGDPLVQFRFVSLAAAFLLLSCLCLILLRYWSAVPVLLSLCALCNNPVFFQYAAENRPYMLWISLFACTVLFACAYYFERTRWLAVLLVGACIALSLAAGPGFLQADATIIGLGIWGYIQKKPFTKRQWQYGLGLLPVCTAIGIFYSLKGCPQWDALEFDLWATKDFNLVIGVLRLLYPKGGMLTQVLNALAFCGLYFSLQSYKKRTLSAAESFALLLALMTILQLFATAGIAVLVVLKPYYFISRVFLQLLVCRIFLIAAGAFFVWQYLQKILPNRQWLSVCVGVGILYLCQFTLRKDISAGWRYQVESNMALPSAQILTECKDLSLLKTKTAATTSQWAANVFARLRRELPRNRANSTQSCFLTLDDAAKNFVLLKEAPLESAVVRLCDQMATYEWHR